MSLPVQLRNRLCVPLLIIYWAFGTQLHADQNAEELPALFDELKQASSHSEASRIESIIWQHWLEAPDEKSGQLMRKITSAMSAGDLAIALEHSDELLESYPDYAEAWNKRATLHYILGDNEASVADIGETLSREPRHFGAISGLGLIFIKEQNFDAALNAFEKVLEISPASNNAKSSVERVRSEIGREI